MLPPAQDRFAPSARRLAGLATRAFGWTPDAFWQATPAELAAVLAADEPAAPQLLDRHELMRLMEREAHGRSD